ncbi:MAG: DNA-directed RNA polymerase subunit K [Candidatus Nanoarchaeia archaeon]|nr:DNA-directed RNA polymerase subunit K [Candidatus Nanoarchaeia archaeon]
MEYTKYEKSRIISTRALQVSMGAPLLIKKEKNEINPIEIARKEFEKGVIPITVKRE